MQDRVRIHLSATSLVNGRAFLALDAAAVPSPRNLTETCQVMLIQAIDRFLLQAAGSAEAGLRITVEVIL